MLMHFGESGAVEPALHRISRSVLSWRAAHRYVDVLHGVTGPAILEPRPPDGTEYYSVTEVAAAGRFQASQLFRCSFACVVVFLACVGVSFSDAAFPINILL